MGNGDDESLLPLVLLRGEVGAPGQAVLQGVGDPTALYLYLQGIPGGIGLIKEDVRMGGAMS